MGPITGTISQPYFSALTNPSIGGYGIGTAQPWHPLQTLQLLQAVPQQLQQVLLQQQQQLLQVQQLLQLIPAQLQQLQQQIQVIPQQVQALQQWQAFNPTISGSIGLGLLPQPFVGQSTGLVM
jgi:hypothetical protein